MADFPDVTLYRGDETLVVTSQDEQNRRIAEGWSLTPTKDQFPQLLWRGPYDRLEEITVHSKSEREQKMGEGFTDERPVDPNTPPAQPVFETRDQGQRLPDQGRAPGEEVTEVQSDFQPPEPDARRTVPKKR